GRLRDHRGNSGRERDELRGIARYAAAEPAAHGERQRIVDVVLHGLAQDNILGAEGRRGGFHGDLFAGRADFELEVESDGGEGLHDDVIVTDRLEADGTGLNGVFSR